MTFRNSAWILALIFLYPGLSAQAQQNALDDYIRQALEKHGLIKEQDALIDQKKAGFMLANRQSGPELTLSTSYTLAAGGRDISFPLGDLLNPVSNALNDLTRTQDFPQYQNQNILFLPNNFYDLRTRISQPILRPEIKINRLIRQEQIGLQELEKEMVERNIIRDVKKAYYQYIQAGDMISILRQALTVLDEGERVTQSLIRNGIALPSAILRIQAEQSKLASQVYAAENQRLNARAFFNYLTGRPESDSIRAISLMALPDPASFTDSIRTEEINSLEKGLAIQRLALDLENKFHAPKLGAQVDLGSQNFNFKWGGYLLAGLQLDVPLYDHKKNKYRKEEIMAGMKAASEKKDWAAKSLGLQLQQAKRQMASAVDQYHSYSPILNMSQRYYWEILRRYKEGQATPAELVEAQAQITSAQLQQNIALYESWIRAAEIESLIKTQ